MFYEITLFDGDASIDVHVCKDEGQVFVTMSDGGPLTRTARRWIKRKFWTEPEAPSWVTEKLESMRK